MQRVVGVDGHGGSHALVGALQRLVVGGEHVQGAGHARRGEVRQVLATLLLLLQLPLPAAAPSTPALGTAAGRGRGQLGGGARWDTGKAGVLDGEVFYGVLGRPRAGWGHTKCAVLSRGAGWGSTVFGVLVVVLRRRCAGWVCTVCEVLGGYIGWACWVGHYTGKIGGILGRGCPEWGALVRGHMERGVLNEGALGMKCVGGGHTLGSQLRLQARTSISFRSVTIKQPIFLGGGGSLSF